ncbi:MAG: hypothetical protein AAF570_02040 [Bacteroidota bacterium]
MLFRLNFNFNLDLSGLFWGAVHTGQAAIGGLVLLIFAIHMMVRNAKYESWEMAPVSRRLLRTGWVSIVWGAAGLLFLLLTTGFGSKWRTTLDAVSFVSAAVFIIFFFILLLGKVKEEPNEAT